MVLEVTGIGQLEFGFVFIFSGLLFSNQARRRRGGNVGIRLPCAGFPSPVGRVGNSFLEFSTLSMGRHFHGARSGSSERSDVVHFLPPRSLRIDSPCISMR
jgi:hypothetical protein